MTTYEDEVVDVMLDPSDIICTLCSPHYNMIDLFLTPWENLKFHWVAIRLGLLLEPLKYILG